MFRSCFTYIVDVSIRKWFPEPRRRSSNTEDITEHSDDGRQSAVKLNVNQSSSVDRPGPSTEVDEELIVKVRDTSLHSTATRDTSQHSTATRHTSLHSTATRDTSLHSTDNRVDDIDGEEAKVVEDLNLAEAFRNISDQIQGFEDCPYFSNPSTVRFIRQSSTMFIMRGLPGSGKSTLVRCLRHLYPESVVCSADDYHIGSDGVYRFDLNKLSEGHTACQTKAGESCKNHTPVVIIDNTNIQRWEMGPYLRLAQSLHYYHTFIVEPRTPWRHNVMELAKRNKHGVETDVLRQKLERLKGQKVFPLYYGWFFTKRDSKQIVKTSKDLLKKCMIEMKTGSKNREALAGILEDFDICYTDPKGMLHCTSIFTGSKMDHAYHHSKFVQASIGKVFKLEIAGFVYTGRSISARINLSSSYEIFNSSNGDMNKAAGNSSGPRKDFNSSGDNSSGSSDQVHNLTALGLYEKEEEFALCDRYKGHSRKESISQHFSHGCSAHATIKVYNDIAPKVAGEEILKMCELDFLRKVHSGETRDGRLYWYSDNMFYLHLKEPLMFDTILHGYYMNSSRR